MTEESPVLEERVLVLAPSGSDAQNVVRTIEKQGLHGEVCQDLSNLCEAARSGVGVLLMAEEALIPSAMSPLLRFLEDQPSWSDCPLVVITTGGDLTQASLRTFAVLAPAGNITLLERPFRLLTLISTLQMALRARKRQYEVRALMAQREADQQKLMEYARDLEKRVEDRTARLAETISELEAFSYSVSHDLRAPLRAMQGYSHFLLEDAAPHLSEECKSYLNRIAACATRLDTLVRDILTYSRVARADIRVESVDLETLLREIIDQYPEFRHPHADIEVRAPLVRVRGHEASLTQCISNLLGNATKFVEPGILPRVKIWTDPREDVVRLWFQDNGIGIDPACQHKLFKIFERGHHEGNYEGTGIGLAIVRKAVERMGGQAGVESRVGAGSRFWIQLPKA